MSHTISMMIDHTDTYASRKTLADFLEAAACAGAPDDASVHSNANDTTVEWESE